MRDDKHKVINENDDIYAPCKCSTRFHEFTIIHSLALKTRLTQKKVTPKRKRRNTGRNSGRKKYRRHVSPTSPNTDICPTTPESASPIPIDTNVPGLPYRSPTLCQSIKPPPRTSQNVRGPAVNLRSRTGDRCLNLILVGGSCSAHRSFFSD